MKVKNWIVLIFTLLLDRGYSQTCIHTDLSRNFDFKITRSEIKSPNTSNVFGELKILIEIYHKRDKGLIQNIQFTSEASSNDDLFKNCSSERSFITGKNSNADVGDLDYGDIVVADFNFDGKEDFAVKNGFYGNIGAKYIFYVQTLNGFKKDYYLTNAVHFFPWFLNPKKKLLITKISPTPGTTIYQYKYNSLSKKWIKISTRFV